MMWPSGERRVSRAPNGDDIDRPPVPDMPLDDSQDQTAMESHAGPFSSSDIEDIEVRVVMTTAAPAALAKDRVALTRLDLDCAVNPLLEAMLDGPRDQARARPTVLKASGGSTLAAPLSQVAEQSASCPPEVSAPAAKMPAKPSSAARVIGQP
jgi:hypothetical protein